MTEQWRELKETIAEMRDNDGTGTQQDVCKFLANLMGVLEKQMQEPMRDATEEELKSVKDYVESISKQTGFNFYEAQPCEDAVSRTLVHEAITASIAESENPYEMWQRIEALPPVTPQRPKGKWIEVFVETPNDPYSYGFKSHKCSKCEYSPLQISNYCPNCGAEMSGGKKHEANN